MRLYENVKQYAPVAVASALLPVTAAPVFAADPAVVTSADWSSVISAMTAQVSVSTVVGVVATTVSAGIGLVFMWWGMRKAVRALFKAFRSGRTSV